MTRMGSGITALGSAVTKQQYQFRDPGSQCWDQGSQSRIRDHGNEIERNHKIFPKEIGTCQRFQSRHGYLDDDTGPFSLSRHCYFLQEHERDHSPSHVRRWTAGLPGHSGTEVPRLDDEKQNVRKTPLIKFMSLDLCSEINKGLPIYNIPIFRIQNQPTFVHPEKNRNRCHSKMKSNQDEHWLGNHYQRPDCTITLPHSLPGRLDI